MADSEPDDITAPQREVQRMLGRCLIRLQQYERLLKAMVATQDLSGTPQTLPHVLEARRAETSDKTMGTLIGRLMGSYIVREGSESSDDMPDPPEGSIYFGFRMQLSLPPDSYARLKADFRELVTLRNTLVHHLLDRHDIWTIQGCHNAQHFLTDAYAEVDKHIEQLRTLAGYMDATRAAAAELMQTPEFLDMVVNGISPEGQIHWPSAGIVSVLRQANRELAVDGWCNLDAGARWVSENHPEQTPQKYGCSRWRHAVHQSGEFELRRFTHNGQFGAWFRERPASSR